MSKWCWSWPWLQLGLLASIEKEIQNLEVEDSAQGSDEGTLVRPISRPKFDSDTLVRPVSRSSAPPRNEPPPRPVQPNIKDGPPEYPGPSTPNVPPRDHRKPNGPSSPQSQPPEVPGRPSRPRTPSNNDHKQRPPKPPPPNPSQYQGNVKLLNYSYKYIHIQLDRWNQTELSRHQKSRWAPDSQKSSTGVHSKLTAQLHGFILKQTISIFYSDAMKEYSLIYPVHKCTYMYIIN